MRSIAVRYSILLGLFFTSLASATTSANLVVGWNLIGNSETSSLDVAARLGDSSKITSVWKWDKTASKWAFYAPSMTNSTLVAYAQSKGYNVLTSIEPKAGFWVNASAAKAVVLTDPSAPPPTPGDPATLLTQSDLAQGWNLLASADNKNPSQLNTGLRDSLNAAGKAMVTAWAWDAPSSKWRFYAPTLEAQGGTTLANYSASKGYLSFNTAPLASEGFWLNIGPGTPAVVTGTPLELAKAFMATLRSNIKALDATDLSLQTELQAVANDLKNRTAPMAMSNLEALNIAVMAVQLWNDVIKNPSAPFVAGKNFYKSDYTPYPEFIGGCGFYSDANYLVPATSKSDSKYIACSTYSSSDYIQATDANGEYKQCTAVGDWCGTQWSMAVRLTPDAVNANKFTIYTQTRESKQTAKTIAFSYWDTTQNKSVSAASCPIGMSCSSYVNAVNQARTYYGAAFPGNAATLVTQRDAIGQVNAVSLIGELSPAFTVQKYFNSYYDYTLQRWVYQQNAVATLLGDKHNVSLSGALTQTGDLNKLALSGFMELIKAGALETRIELADGSYLQAKPGSMGNYSAQDGSQEMLLKLKAGTAGSTITGDLRIGAFKADASSTSYIPTSISFSGTVQRNGVSFFDGTVTAEALNYASFNARQPWSSSNFQTTRVGFVGHINIPTRTVLEVALAVTHNDFGNFAPETALLSGQYVQGDTIINVSGSDGAASNIVTLESTSGVKLVMDQSKSSYPLTVNGQTAGVYSTINNMLTYTDNSYEQF